MSDINADSGAFQPVNCGQSSPSTLAIAATTGASASAQLTPPITPALNPSRQIRAYNSTNGIAYVSFGANASTVAIVPSAGVTGDIPIAPGAERCLTVPVGVKFAAAILATGSTAGNVYFTPGSGK